MGWVILIGGLVVVVGLTAIYPRAVRYDRTRADARGLPRHPWLHRSIFIAVVLLLAGIGIFLLYF